MRISITKEEALRRVKGYLTDYLPIEDGGELDEIMEALEQGPEWVSVSEKLPEERDTYEVTLQGIGELEGIDNEVAYATWLGKDWIYHNVDNWTCRKVIAWKPLSKPYKPQENENK